MSTLTDFQLGQGTDSQGRTIDEIRALNDFWLEHDHKYIQWLFPIDTQNKFNRDAPVVTKDDILAFGSCDVLKMSQLQSLTVMLRFFGMQWRGTDIVPMDQLNIRDHIWLKRGGHNHLRISRIIRSLALCGQPELSATFRRAMLKAAEQFGEVSEESKGYWAKAGDL